MGPLPPASLGQRFGSWLGSLGMMPSQARNWGSAVDWSPAGAGYQGGLDIGRGIEQGDPWAALGGAAQVGLAAAPIALPRPAPRPPGLSFGAGDVEMFLRDAGARNVRLREARTGGSSYVDFGSNTSPRTVRIPADAHSQPPGAADFSRLIDTGTSMRTPATHNAQGMPYSEWDTLTAELSRIIEAGKRKPRVPRIGGNIAISR